MNEPITMTVAQAKEAGYEYFGYEDNDYQALQPLDDFNNIDQYGKKWFLFDKNERYTPSIDADTIADILADHMMNDVDDNVGDDTDYVYDVVRALDFSQAAEMINERLKNHKYYFLSSIQLVPNDTPQQ